MKRLFLIAGLGLAVSLAGSTGSHAKQADSAAAAQDQRDSLRQAAGDAYLLLYPLVLNDAMRRQAMANRAGGNGLHHERAFAESGEVRPSYDTLTSRAWIDLAMQPYVLRLPPSPDRYSHWQVIDSWGTAMTVHTSRGDATPRTIALVPPGWQGELPEGTERLDAPAARLQLIGIVHTYGEADYPAVHRIQDAMLLAPLSGQVTSEPAVHHKETGLPARVLIDAMAPLEFFRTAADLLARQPLPDAGPGQIAQLARLGIGPGKRAGLARFSAEESATLAAGVSAARALLTARRAAGSGWSRPDRSLPPVTDSVLARAIAARRGTIDLPPDQILLFETAQDRRGMSLQGGKAYALRFESGQLPATGTFWSLSLYDGAGLPLAPPVARRTLASRDPLRFNPDGSLDLLIQPSDPGGSLSANWLALPPSGAVRLVLRVYQPGSAMLRGDWSPPPIEPL